MRQPLEMANLSSRSPTRSQLVQVGESTWMEKDTLEEMEAPDMQAVPLLHPRVQGNLWPTAEVVVAQLETMPKLPEARMEP
jgi:hypothetical protein